MAAPLTLAEIDALLADNTSGDISAEDMRDVAGALFGYSNPLQTGGYAFVYDDFTQSGSWTNGGPFTSSVSGTSASVAASDVLDGSDMGVIRLKTGSTTTGRAGLTTSVTGFSFGVRELRAYAKIWIPTLSNATDEYTLRFGFGDQISNLSQADGAFFLYDRAGATTGSAASANWQIVTSSNSTRTFTTSATVVATGAYLNLEVRVNAAATSVDYLINGSSIGTVTTNIPSGVARACGMQLNLVKSAGTTDTAVDADRMAIRRLAA